MKKTLLACIFCAALVLSLAACGVVPPAKNETPAVEPQTAETGTEAQTANTMTAYRADGSAVILEYVEDGVWKDEHELLYYLGEGGVLRARGAEDLYTERLSAAEPEIIRQDGERFETVIILEGMEETVRYEHIRNDALGLEMDYDYEEFVRRSEADREIFVSDWDDPDNPENYLELRYNPQDAEAVAANICAFLSGEYEVRRDDAFALEQAGSCIRIDADEVKGGGYMPDQLQTVYIIPAGDGCRIAWEHTHIVESEGFGRRFAYMMQTFSILSAQGEKKLTDAQAVTAIRNYCFIQNPDLADIVKDGEYPDYWEVLSSDGNETLILFRSHTGAQNRYYIDPVSGEAYVTELVPGIIDEEQRTDESLNVWDYWF